MRLHAARLKEPAMLNFQSPSFLRRVLLVDAAASAATGLLMVVGAGLLQGLLELPASLLQSAGFILLPFAALVAWLATRQQPWRAAVWAVIIANALWTLESIALLLSGSFAPNVLGQVFVVAQAAVVVVLAELEYFALRRAPAVAAG
jgi:hypothetical protein